MRRAVEMSLDQIEGGEAVFGRIDLVEYLSLVRPFGHAEHGAEDFLARA
jgi:hypothetical protein